MERGIDTEECQTNLDFRKQWPLHLKSTFMVYVNRLSLHREGNDLSVTET